MREIKSPPLRIVLGSSAEAQERAVAASNHREAISDQARGCVAQRGGFPRLGSNAIDAEDDAGDLAVARTVHAAVNRLKHVAIASALLAR